MSKINMMYVYQTLFKNEKIKNSSKLTYYEKMKYLRPIEKLIIQNRKYLVYVNLQGTLLVHTPSNYIKYMQLKDRQEYAYTMFYWYSFDFNNRFFELNKNYIIDTDIQMFRQFKNKISLNLEDLLSKLSMINHNDIERYATNLMQLIDIINKEKQGVSINE